MIFTMVLRDTSDDHHLREWRSSVRLAFNHRLVQNVGIPSVHNFAKEILIMKIMSAILTALCLLAASCKNEQPNQTTAATSGTTSAASDTASTSNFRNATTSRFTPATDLTVTFSGMIVFALSNGVERAVVLRTTGHNLQIVFPATMKTEVETVFAPRKCGIECIVPFDDLSFQIVDKNGTPLSTGFNPSSTFKTDVTHLSRVPLSASLADTFDVGNIEKDVFDKPNKSTLIGGFFALAGGDGTVTPFRCLAHYGSDKTTSQKFPKVVSVNFKLPPGAKLQVNKGGAGWVDLVTLTALPGPLSFVVDNNMGSKVSHFDNYARLSKKRDGGKVVKLPDVNLDDPSCVEGFGDVPGCSDSQWP